MGRILEICHAQQTAHGVFLAGYPSLPFLYSWLADVNKAHELSIMLALKSGIVQRNCSSSQNFGEKTFETKAQQSG